MTVLNLIHAGGRTAVLLLAGGVLSGCASFSADGGFGPVQQLTRERIGLTPGYWRQPAPDEAGAQRVAELLGQPLGADGAVEIALLNNRLLQARYAELGVAEADAVRAGRLANPSLRFGRLGAGSAVEFDRGISFNLLALLTLPLAREAGAQQLQQRQWQAAGDTVVLAAQVRRAYYEAVAARQLLDAAVRAQEAADTAAELSRRMAEAGNFSALQRLRAQLLQAESAAQRQRLQHQALATRERLLRALGLGGTPAPTLQLPDQLPELPAQPPEAPHDAEQRAMALRLDVLAARRDAEATAAALGLSRATRMVNVLHLGYQNSRHSGEALREGYEIELELPLFDFGSARVARAEAVYLQALHRAAAVADNARSEVREAWSAYRSAWSLARQQRDELLPLRQRIAEEQLLRYNGMLISVFDLLADAREQAAGSAAAVQALREHWIAHSELQLALSGRSVGALSSAASAESSTASGLEAGSAAAAADRH